VVSLRYTMKESTNRIFVGLHELCRNDPPPDRSSQSQAVPNDKPEFGREVRMDDILDDVQETLLESETRVRRGAKWFYEDFTCMPLCLS
jgi:hypothetical protein